MHESNEKGDQPRVSRVFHFDVGNFSNHWDSKGIRTIYFLNI